ncbi:class I nuclease [Histomonas meleagridis]|uniref:class I nuclease n=1 Tax=Histomonas meleagridis TaxID=135588 RepID=UPI0035598803|nr:class I nuclease [Histomonas meleagridis]KAH0803223.1 class I nuclease [Histomonas meleagridis]
MILRIAQSFISTSEKNLLEQIMNYGSMTHYDFLHVATWQDDLKDYSKFKGMSNWHFMDNPVVRTEKKVNLIEPSYNISGYLLQSFETIQDKTTTHPWALAFHLRSIIHFVGDVHTPHHNCMLYDDDHLSGDYGGNSYYLNCEYGSACNNIHFLWDSVGLKYPITDPTIPRYLDEFEKNYSLIIEQFPKSYFTDKKYDLESLKPLDWNDESYQYCVMYGYNTTQQARPSDEYFKLVQDRGAERVALAGYRLGYILRYILDNMELPSYGNNTTTILEIVFWILDVACVTIIVIFAILLRKKLKLS